MSDKNRRADFSAYSKLSILFLVAIIGARYGPVEGLRMKPGPAVTSNMDFLMVGVPARLTCNYIAYRSETVREITWYAGYNGMSSKVCSILTKTHFY